jgi:hypothetical protein
MSFLKDKDFLLKIVFMNNVLFSNEILKIGGNI